MRTASPPSFAGLLLFPLGFQGEESMAVTVPKAGDTGSCFLQAVRVVSRALLT